MGKNASTLIDYFERNGAPAIPADANPAEWMLQVIEPPKDGSDGSDWHQTWRNSPEYRGVKRELARLRALPSTDPNVNFDKGHVSQHQEFVSSIFTQFREVMIRTARHFWRSPVYMWSKTSLIALSVSANNVPFSHGA